MTKKVIKAIAFILGLCLILAAAQHVFVYDDFRIYQSVGGFYAEEKNKLDAVYVGASNVYAFFQPAVAWNEHGIAVYTLSTPSMLIPAVKNYLIEARKTQPDALYIINLNNCRNARTVNEARLHYVSDYMKFSLNKVDMIEKMVDYTEFSDTEKLEFYFPFIRYHSNWEELTAEHFTRKLNGMKGSSYYSLFIKTREDITKACTESDKRRAIPENVEAELDDLLDYCEKEQVNVLFAIVPQGLENVKHGEILNSVADKVTERGFTLLNLLHSFDELSLDKTKDFYDHEHTNVHGSIKFTHYLSKYLIENYGFEDKRGIEEYADWDQGAKDYYDMIGVYTYPFEHRDELRDLSMRMPQELTAKQKKQSVSVAWEAVEGATGYYVYRRDRDAQKVWGVWNELAYVDGTQYTDATVEKGLRYTYVAVPVKEVDDRVLYGDVDYAGVSITVK